VQEKTWKVFSKLETLPFIDKVYGENLSLQKGTFRLSLKLKLLSSPEERLWFSALARAKRLRPLWFYLYSQGRRKDWSPKVPLLPKERKGAEPPKF
jgi:hypothetical protein